MHLSKYNFSYLTPYPHEYENIQHDPKYIQDSLNGMQIRRIYKNQTYKDFELQGISQLKKAVLTQLKEADMNYFDDSQLLRYCYAGDFNVQKSIEVMKSHISWLNDPTMHTLNDNSLKILQQGIFYLYGRDKQNRPIICINVDKVDLKQMKQEDFMTSWCVFAQLIKKYMCVPGKIENWIILFEFNQMSIWSLPIKVLAYIFSICNVNFADTLHQGYLLNPPYILKKSWGLIQKMMHPFTATKIIMINDSKEYYKLLEVIDADQLQQKYGGKLQNCDKYFPPQKTFNLQESNLNLDGNNSIQGSSISTRLTSHKLSNQQECEAPHHKKSGVTEFYSFDCIEYHSDEIEVDEDITISDQYFCSKKYVKNTLLNLNQISQTARLS